MEWAAVVGAVLTGFFKFVGWLLDEIGAKKETKKKFIAFVIASQKKRGISIGLNEDYEKLMAEMEAEDQKRSSTITSK
jgi:hypothetical protein